MIKKNYYYYSLLLLLLLFTVNIARAGFAHIKHGMCLYAKTLMELSFP